MLNRIAHLRNIARLLDAGRRNCLNHLAHQTCLANDVFDAYSRSGNEFDADVDLAGTIADQRRQGIIGRVAPH